ENASGVECRRACGQSGDDHERRSGGGHERGYAGEGRALGVGKGRVSDREQSAPAEREGHPTWEPAEARRGNRERGSEGQLPGPREGRVVRRGGRGRGHVDRPDERGRADGDDKDQETAKS